MKAALRFLIGWLLGALVTVGVAILFQTWNVVARLRGIGAEISLSDHFAMTIYDLIHLGSLYGLFILIGTLIAYLVGLLVYRVAGFGRLVIFVVAGAIAMIVMLIAMKEAFFGVHLIAGARDIVGLSLQMLAGAIGGGVFAVLTAYLAARQEKKKNADAQAA